MLSEGPLLRATLLRLRSEEHVVLVTMHHIISDGWSMGVLIEEVAALYRAYVQGRRVAVGGVGDPVCGLRGVAAGVAAGRGAGAAVGVLARAIERSAGGAGVADGPTAAGGADAIAAAR